MSLFAAYDIGSSGLTAQAMRLNVTASNIANAESVAQDVKCFKLKQKLQQFK